MSNNITLNLGLVVLGLCAQEAEIASIINLELDRKEDISILLDLGIAADHNHSYNPGTLELFVSQRERKILDDHGFEYTVKISDMKLHADKLAKKNEGLDLNICER